MFGMSGFDTSFVLVVAIVALAVCIYWITNAVKEVRIAKHTGITPYEDDEGNEIRALRPSSDKPKPV